MHKLINDTAASASVQSEVTVQNLIDRADFFYCLSRAFLPPPASWHIDQWSEPLLGDLKELSMRMGIDCSHVEQALMAEQKRGQSNTLQSKQPDSWLVEYSRIFLVPPVPVTLNAGVYLEGALGGSSVQMMRSCYESVGVEPSDMFHDLPDHVAMQFEFVGWLYQQAANGDPDADAMAAEFTREFIAIWLPALENSCQSSRDRVPAASVFTALCRLVGAAIK